MLYTYHVLKRAKQNTNVVIHEAFIPLIPRYKRHIGRSSGLHSIIDWDVALAVINFQLPPPDLELHPNTLYDLIKKGESISDLIVYTTYRNGVYVCLSYAEDITATFPMSKQTSKRFMDVLGRNSPMQSQIDTSIGLIEAHPLHSDLSFSVGDNLFPDLITMNMVHQEDIERDRDFILDYCYVKEGAPTWDRPPDERHLDWTVEEDRPNILYTTRLNGELPDILNDNYQVYLMPQTCLIHPLKYSVYKTYQYLPSLLTYINTVHGINEIRNVFLKHNIHMEYQMLVEAFTTKNISQFFNYDILEIYGDAFLKYYICTRLVLMDDVSTPDDLEKIKHRLVSNRVIAESGRKVHLDRYIRSRSVVMMWGECSTISYNVIADVLEAVIGSVAYHRSLEECIRATGYLCGDKENNVNTVVAAHVRGYQPQSVFRHISDTLILSSETLQQIQILEKAQKYEYQNKQLALLALSSDHGGSFNYEILEYLGDAVVEWLVMDLIVEVDRNHRISRSVDILRCKKGSIPICPFTVTCILIGITASIALKRSLVANQHFANLMIENGIFEAIPKHSRGYIEAEHYKKWRSSQYYIPNWNRVKMKDYVECIRLITIYNYVLFETDTGPSLRKFYEKQAISSYYQTKEIIDSSNSFSNICIPSKLLGDMFESALGAMYLECGFRKCQEHYRQWFEKDIEDGIITGDLCIDALECFNNVMVALGIIPSQTQIVHREVDKGTVYELIYEKKANRIVFVTLKMFNDPHQKKEDIIHYLLWKHATEAIIDCVKKMEPIPKKVS